MNFYRKLTHQFIVSLVPRTPSSTSDYPCATASRPIRNNDNEQSSLRDMTYNTLDSALRPWPRQCPYPMAFLLSIGLNARWRVLPRTGHIVILHAWPSSECAIDLQGKRNSVPINIGRCHLLSLISFVIMSSRFSGPHTILRDTMFLAQCT